MRFMIWSIMLFSILAPGAEPAAADFDAARWAKYAVISLPEAGELPPFGRIDLKAGDDAGQNPDSIRVITRSRREMPLEIVVRRPETRSSEIRAKIVNMSLSSAGDTSFEGALENKEAVYNAIEIVVEGSGFFRQVQIFGSPDGVNWHKIRSDAVIFDYRDDRPFRHTRIKLPDTKFRYLKAVVKNRLEPPLKITGLRIFNDKKDCGIDEVVAGRITGRDADNKSKTSSIEVAFSYAVGLHGVEIKTDDRNFRRLVDVYIKRGKGQWTKWGSDFIFNYEGEGMKESKTVVSVPEVSSGELRLVVGNLDSPPLNIREVYARAYRKSVVFKTEGREDYFMFWGNAGAERPVYDISGHVSRQDFNAIPVFGLGETRDNPDYTGGGEEGPLTERYKYLLYILAAMVIAVLFYYQYRVIRRTGG
jgi:hypothetical protein